MGEEPKKPPEDLASLRGAKSPEKGEKLSEIESSRVKLPKPEEEKAEAPPEEKPKVGTKMSSEEVVSREPVEAEVMEEAKGGKLDELLQELNITKKHLFVGFGCLILLIFGIFFGIRLVTSFFEKREKTQPTAVTVTEPEGLSQPRLDKSLVTAFEFSKIALFPPYFFPQGGVELGIHLGLPAFEQKDLLRMTIILLRRMQNAYQTNVNELLQKSANRRGVLENHLTLLRHFVDEASTTKAQVETEISNLTPVHEQASGAQEIEEKNFFEALEKLDTVAGTSLDEFIDQAKMRVESRAKLRALEAIHRRLSRAIPRMEARIRDVELNKEALIAGTKIYDVRGSDLNLIIPEAGVPEEEAVPPGASRLLPGSRYTFPFDLPPQDFIRTPGGHITK